MFCIINVGSDKLRIQKNYYNAIAYENDLTEKARDDSFEPTTVPSKRFKIWRAVLDIKTCFDCADNHGRIFDIHDPAVKLPPLHFCCRCRLARMEAIEAGGATNNGTNGADYWLKCFGKLPDYYISREQLEALGWEIGDRPSQFAPGKMLGGNVYIITTKESSLIKLDGFGVKPI